MSFSCFRVSRDFLHKFQSSAMLETASSFIVHLRTYIFDKYMLEKKKSIKDMCVVLLLFFFHGESSLWLFVDIVTFAAAAFRAGIVA